MICNANALATILIIDAPRAGGQCGGKAQNHKNTQQSPERPVRKVGREVLHGGLYFLSASDRECRARGHGGRQRFEHSRPIFRFLGADDAGTSVCGTCRLGRFHRGCMHHGEGCLAIKAGADGHDSRETHREIQPIIGLPPPAAQQNDGIADSAYVDSGKIARRVRIDGHLHRRHGQIALPRAR